jgi:hypothetical protein
MQTFNAAVRGVTYERVGHLDALRYAAESVTEATAPLLGRIAEVEAQAKHDYDADTDCRNLLSEENDCLRQRIAALEGALADDLRADGWAVAVHNDYRMSGLPHTFWLMTKGHVCIKGEGPTDADALNEIRRAIRFLALSPTQKETE